MSQKWWTFLPYWISFEDSTWVHWKTKNVCKRVIFHVTTFLHFHWLHLESRHPSSAIVIKLNLDPSDLPGHGNISDRRCAAGRRSLVLATNRNGGMLRLNASRHDDVQTCSTNWEILSSFAMSTLVVPVFGAGFRQASVLALNILV